MSWDQVLALAITNTIKIAGLVIALKTVLFSQHIHDQAIILAIAGLMMTGAQLSEDVLLGLAYRWLGLPIERRLRKPDQESTDQKEHS